MTILSTDKKVNSNPQHHQPDSRNYEQNNEDDLGGVSPRLIR